MTTINDYSTCDRHIVVGGMTLEDLAEQVGSTPFFVYDSDRLTERVRVFRSDMPNEVMLSYAIKANPMPAVVNHMAKLIDGFDVASSGEIDTVLQTQIHPSRISFAGPGKTEREIEKAISAGVTLSIESDHQLQVAAEVGERLGVRPHILVRVNPSFKLQRAGLAMAGDALQFGIDADQVPETLKQAAALDLDFQGFHVFAGSQCLVAEVIAETQKKVIELSTRLAAAAPAPVRHINIGGGFGIPYRPSDQPLDTAVIGDTLAETLATDLRPKLPDATVSIELGRWLVGEAGVYVARVIDRKRSKDRQFLITDGGLHHHLAAAGLFGQVVRQNFPVAIGNRMNGGPMETVTVAGCLCTPMDVLARNAELPKAEIGDLFVVFLSGAYGATASPTAFLSHEKPKEIMV